LRFKARAIVEKLQIENDAYLFLQELRSLDGLIPQISTAIHQLEHGLLFDHVPILEKDHYFSGKTLEWTNLVRTGQNIELLRQAELPSSPTGDDIMADLLAYRMSSSSTVEELFQLELVGVAALHLFLQVNYTGPSLEQVAQLSGGDLVDEFPNIIKPH
jgi:hypothetical protein